MADIIINVPGEKLVLTGEERFRRVFVWQAGVRIFHWVSALSIAALFATGLLIAFPKFASTGEPHDSFAMGRVRQIHFVAAFIFTIAFFWRIFLFWFGNKYCRSGFPFIWRPSWWRDLFQQATDYLRLEFGHIHMGHNALAGLAYTIFAIGLGWAQLFTGFALYSESNPGGFFDPLVGWVVPLCGGSFQTHMWHHLFAWGFVFFAIVHVYIVVLDGLQFRNGLIGSMITGIKFVQDPEGRSTK